MLENYNVYLLIAVCSALFVVALLIVFRVAKIDERIKIQSYPGKLVLLYNQELREFMEVDCGKFRDRKGWAVIAITAESEIAGFVGFISSMENKKIRKTEQMKRLFTMYLKTREWYNE